MPTVQETTGLAHKLLSYLRDRYSNPALDLASPLTQLQGGFETTIYRFSLHGAPPNLSGPLVLRLYPRFYGTGNATWESTVQNVMAEAGYPVARAHVVCTELSVLGGAWFIMDHLPGRLLAAAPPETVPALLGETHAALHALDPQPLAHALRGTGIGAGGYSLDSRFDWLRDRGAKLPWIRQGVAWLLDNRPSDPERLSVCHGDYHVLNVLQTGGKVTGVLDWGGFAIADPAYDVANSLVLITIPPKYLAGSLGLAQTDWNRVAELYLAAYRDHRFLDDTNLDYYRARRCVLGLVQGVEGQKVWQHPLIVQDLIATILAITGIRITMPDPLALQRHEL